MRGYIFLLLMASICFASYFLWKRHLYHMAGEGFAHILNNWFKWSNWGVVLHFAFGVAYWFTITVVCITDQTTATSCVIAVPWAAMFLYLVICSFAYLCSILGFEIYMYCHFGSKDDYKISYKQFQDLFPAWQDTARIRFMNEKEFYTGEFGGIRFKTFIDYCFYLQFIHHRKKNQSATKQTERDVEFLKIQQKLINKYNEQLTKELKKEQPGH